MTLVLKERNSKGFYYYYFYAFVIISFIVAEKQSGLALQESEYREKLTNTEYERERGKTYKVVLLARSGLVTFFSFPFFFLNNF